MSGNPNFEVVTDRSGRPKHFVAVGYDGAQVLPEEMREYLRGTEIVEHRDQEYVLTADGNLIHVGVELPPPEVVELGSGVLIGAGVTFEDNGEPESGQIVIGDRSKVIDSTLHSGVEIGPLDVILGSELGPGTKTGQQVRIREGVATGEDVSMANCVKVDIGSQIDNGVVIDYAASLGHNTVVGAGAIIGRNSEIGKPVGDPTVQTGQEGIVIPEGAIVEPHITLPEDVSAG